MEDVSEAVVWKVSSKTNMTELEKLGYWLAVLVGHWVFEGVVKISLWDYGLVMDISCEPVFWDKDMISVLLILNERKLLTI